MTSIDILKTEFLMMDSNFICRTRKERERNARKGTGRKKEVKDKVRKKSE